MEPRRCRMPVRCRQPAAGAPVAVHQGQWLPPLESGRVRGPASACCEGPPCLARCPGLLIEHGLRREISTGIVTTTLLAAVGFEAPALAGSLSGTASYRERIALPPDAVFEAVLIDAAIADAPARELGRVRLQPAGQPPFRFSIPYSEREITPGGRYTVRATVRQGERLLFTTDTFTPVLTGGPSQPLNLVMVQVDSCRPPSPSSPLGRLPASWRGDLPAASGTTRWQVDLASDGSFQL